MNWLIRIFQASPLAGVLDCLLWASSGVRYHPGARTLGRRSHVAAGQKTKIGPGTVLDVRTNGRISFGPRCWLYRDIEICPSREIVIGPSVSLQKGVTFIGNIRIGGHCLFAPNVFVSSGGHVYDRWPELPIRIQESREIGCARGEESHKGWIADRPVVIDEDCWIGINAVVMPSVRIGRGAIVGANSVVTKNVTPYTIVAGSPAKHIGTRVTWRPPTAIDATRISAIPYLYEGFSFSMVDNDLIVRIGSNCMLAMDAVGDGTLELRIHADSTGMLMAEGQRLGFDRGLSMLRVKLSVTTASPWEGAHFIRIAASSSGKATSPRLMGASWVPNRDREQA